MHVTNLAIFFFIGYQTYELLVSCDGKLLSCDRKLVSCDRK